MNSAMDGIGAADTGREAAMVETYLWLVPWFGLMMMTGVSDHSHDATGAN